MDERHAVLVYDGACAYCRRLVGLLRWFDHQGLLTFWAYDSRRAQSVLKAQFGAEQGFTMYLFTNTDVYWAQAAARQATQMLKFPVSLSLCVERVYPTLVRAISMLSGRRRRVCTPGRACFALTGEAGSVPVTPKALGQLNA